MKVIGIGSGGGSLDGSFNAAEEKRLRREGRCTSPGVIGSGGLELKMPEIRFTLLGEIAFRST